MPVIKRYYFFSTLNNKSVSATIVVSHIERGKWSHSKRFAFYLSLSLTVIWTNLAQTWCRCCKLSVSTVLNVWFTTNGMCMNNNSHIYVARTSRNRISTTCALYFCLLPQCEAMCTCGLSSPIATKWCCDQEEGCTRCNLHKKNLRLLRFIAKRRGCCSNLLVGVALKVRFTTNGMCAMSNTEIYVAWTSNNRVISSGDHCCYLLPQCEVLHTCRSSFLIATQEIYTSLTFTFTAHENDQRCTLFGFRFCDIPIYWRIWML